MKWKAPDWAAAPPFSDSRKLGGGDGVDVSVDAIGEEAAAGCADCGVPIYDCQNFRRVANHGEALAGAALDGGEVMRHVRRLAERSGVGIGRVLRRNIHTVHRRRDRGCVIGSQQLIFLQDHIQPNISRVICLYCQNLRRSAEVGWVRRQPGCCSRVCADADVFESASEGEKSVFIGVSAESRKVNHGFGDGGGTQCGA